MSDPQFSIRMEADLKSMRFNMAKFIDVELDKQRDQLRAIAEKAVADFDVKREVEAVFAAQARSRIQDILRVECGQKAAQILEDFDIKITVTPKVKHG